MAFDLSNHRKLWTFYEAKILSSINIQKLWEKVFLSFFFLPFIPSHSLSDLFFHERKLLPEIYGLNGDSCFVKLWIISFEEHEVHLGIILSQAFFRKSFANLFTSSSLKSGWAWRRLKRLLAKQSRQKHVHYIVKFYVLDTMLQRILNDISGVLMEMKSVCVRFLDKSMASVTWLYLHSIKIHLW